PPTPALAPLPLPDALPISPHARTPPAAANVLPADWAHGLRPPQRTDTSPAASCPGLCARRGHGSASGPSSPSAPTHATLPPAPRSEEHTSELQSRENLVCR